MANISVSNLTEFLTACANATADDKIICPENAEWDWESLGRTSETEISVSSEIEGNGAKIRNFFGRLTGNWKTFKALHFLNAVHYSTGYFSQNIRWELSQISVQLGVDHTAMSQKSGFYRCSINVDFQHAGSPIIGQAQNAYYEHDRKMEFCRVKISAPNATGAALNYGDMFYTGIYPYYNCEVILNCPQATELGCGPLYNCTIRGDLQCVETADYYGNKCAIDTKSMTELDMSGWSADKAKWFVTDAQMHDITYLHNIGFEIGSDV